MDRQACHCSEMAELMDVRFKECFLAKKTSDKMVSEEDLITSYSDGSEQDTVNVTKDVPQSLSGMFTPFVAIWHTM